MTDAVEQADAGREALIQAFRASTAGPAEINATAALLHADWPATDEALAADQLIAELLLSMPVCPYVLEFRLTALRRRLLMTGASEVVAPLLANLAIQGLINEYAWAQDAAEEARVADLAARIDSLTPTEVMLLACYAPLWRIAGAQSLLARGWSGPVERVLREHIAAWRQEQALQARIPAITPIRGGVSEAVRGQYEIHPYPRWRAVMRPAVRSEIFGWRPPRSPNVLIAGCGTGYHAIQAGQRYAGSRVLAADLSRASLGYGLRKAREAGVGNVAFAQADLLELGSSGLRFDAIECSGVLHHLQDPFEGARVLAGLLKPGGAIKIALYSAAAREDLKPAKALARRYGPDAIRELRQAIVAAPQGDPVRAPMRVYDFYAASGCRDLLLHVQEHEMAIADIRRMLAESGLTLLGFDLGPHRAAYDAMFPDDARAADLDHVEAFERANPTTFRAMYQFWSTKAA